MQLNLNSNSNSSVQFNTSRSTKFLLMGLLFILNIIIRIPSIPHEKGYDSFFIHSLANSVSSFGAAKWWINWMSVFGLYPYSYASAVPFTLSGISQLIGIRMESVILIFCVIIGLFSMFSSYTLAKVLYDSFLHRFLFVFLYSLSACTLENSTWAISTRAQIIVFLPLFLYLAYNLIKFKIKFALLFILTTIFLLATHHYVYIALFYSGIIIIFSLIYKFNIISKYFKVQKTHLQRLRFNQIYILVLFVLLLLIFFNGSEWGLITAGSRYNWIIDILIIAGRNSGPIVLLSLGGLLYLINKQNKFVEEWITLIWLPPTIIFSFNQIYGYICVFLLASLYGSNGLFNIIRNQEKNTKIVSLTVIIFLILTVTFSSFFLHYHLGTKGGYDEWYMQEKTYQAGEWITNYASKDKVAVCNGFEASRMVASSDGPIAYAENVLNYVNGLTTIDKDMYENSPFSKEFYVDNPVTSKTDTEGALRWTSLFPITDKRAKGFLQSINVYYFYQDTTIHNELFSSLPGNKNQIFDCKRIRIFTN